MEYQKIKDKTKGIIERFQTLIAIILIPVGLGLANLLLDNTKIEQEYLKISLSIIQDNNSKINPALRDWAVDVLVKYSKPKISKELAEELKNGLDFSVQAPIDSSMNTSNSKLLDTALNIEYASDGVWFTIVSSIPISFEEKKVDSIANNIYDKISAKGKKYSIELYKTTFSNRYAITLNGEQNKSDAIKLARLVRELDIEKTSFAQINKKWIFIKKYPFE